MDSAFDRYSNSPERGKLPLHPVSPSRENRRPTSPSLSSISPIRSSQERFASSHTRSGSDVQNKVAAFNNLTREAAQRRKDNEAALKRAMLGREEAESETRRLKEENDALRRLIEEGRGRERKVGERLESIMEALQQANETQAQAQAVYEKEVRRARKEAFKSSSALVKLQEELKTARNRYTLMRVDAEDHKQRLISKEEELCIAQKHVEALQMENKAPIPDAIIGGIDAQPQESKALLEGTPTEQPHDQSSSHQETAAVEKELREVSEELFILQQKLSKAERKFEKAEMQKQIVEEERDALKKSMEEEQLAKSAAQGALALPSSRDTFGAPNEDHVDDIEVPTGQGEPSETINEPQEHDDKSKLLEELSTEKRRRLEAEEQFHFSQIECQLRCCSCRRAERQSREFVHDGTFAALMKQRAPPANAKGKETASKSTLSERSRTQKIHGRSTTPRIMAPQRPRSQQAPARQQSPKLFERPRSQQIENRRNVPRPYQHSRSITETTFKSARDLDSQAKRSISHARVSSTTPGPPTRNRNGMERQVAPTPREIKGKRELDVNNEIEIDLNSPWPQPPATNHKIQPLIGATTGQVGQPPSPTLDFNFTEIIPNIPSIPRPLPTPQQPPSMQVDDLFGDDPLRTESTTITIPLKSDTPEFFSPTADALGGISREEALEQIRARRGRARSYAASHGAPTPKKGITGTPRREISAPSLKRL